MMAYMARAIEAEYPAKRRAVDAFFKGIDSVQGRLYPGAESHLAFRPGKHGYDSAV